jgi:hypothetical protein
MDDLLSLISDDTDTAENKWINSSMSCMRPVLDSLTSGLRLTADAADKLLQQEVGPVPEWVC